MGESSSPSIGASEMAPLSLGPRGPSLRLLALIPVVLFFAALLAFEIYGGIWYWESGHVYSILGEAGGVISILLGFTLFLLRDYRTEGDYLPFIATGFVGMGLIEASGGFSLRTHTLAWLDCLAIVWGSILLNAVWLPKSFLRKHPSPVRGLWLVSLFISLGVIFWGDPLLPGFVDNTFPIEIKALSFFCGLLFLAYVPRILKVVSAPERQIVTVICLYQGFGGVTLPLMRMWGPRWWLIQILQFIPYVIAVGYLIRIFLTSQKALFRSEERFRKLVSASPIGIGLVDNRDYSFVHANPALCRMLGFSEEELTRRNLKTLIHPDDVFGVFEDRNKLLRGSAPNYRSEKRYINRQNQTVWVKTSGALIQSESGAPQEVRLIEDITDEKVARDRVHRLIEELASSKAELERFTSIASHDLKSPLRTIRSFVELLSRKLTDKADPETVEYMRFIVDASERLTNLIDDLLTYSRVSGVVRKFEATECSTVVGEALDNLKFDIESCGGKVTVDPLPVVSGDRFQLLELFQNLISNAIKYRGQRRPEVHISAEGHGDEWIFSIRDNGIGFSMENAEIIFAEFHRLHNPREYPGTGLGLPICRTIAHRHGGRIWATSTPGKGSTFSFSLPKRSDRIRAGTSAEDAPPISPQPSI